MRNNQEALIRGMRVWISLVMLVMVYLPSRARADENAWELLRSGIQENAMVSVSIDLFNPERIFAASRRAIYESTDTGKSWRQIFRVPAQVNITELAVENADKPAVLITTDNGLYASFDGGMRWSGPFRGTAEGQKNCTYVAFHPKEHKKAVLGTQGGLFISYDRGLHWEEQEVPRAARDVRYFAFDPVDLDRVYLISDQGLFIGGLNGGKWQQRIGVFRAEDNEMVEQSEIVETKTEEGSDSFHRLSAIAAQVDDPPALYLASSSGLQVSTDKGLTWRWLSQIGLASAQISRVLPLAHSPLTIYAATQRGVSRYINKEDRWHAVGIGLTSIRIRDLDASTEALWAATDRGIFRYNFNQDEFTKTTLPTPQELLANFSHEPTITQVQRAAIYYAEVHPEKIKRWRHQAMLQAFLPTFSIDFDQNDDLHITSKGSTSDPTTDRFLIMDDPSKSFDLSLKWDLGELIWNGAQTLIDVRSKLMVQLRDDILDEVTRAYFERRRIQVAMLTHPPSDQQALLDKLLRIDELTALMDGLTGSYFSRQMELNDNQ